jgi:hypothetical protein
MKDHLRFRNIFMIGGTIIVMVYLYLSDPNGGNLTIPFLAKLATPVVAVWFAHLARRALFDYADMETLLKKARETATGAGLAFLGLCLIIYGLLSLFGSQVYAQPVASYIPEQAHQHLSTLQLEKNRVWAAHPKPHTLLV